MVLVNEWCSPSAWNCCNYFLIFIHAYVNSPVGYRFIWVPLFRAYWLLVHVYIFIYICQMLFSVVTHYDRYTWKRRKYVCQETERCCNLAHYLGHIYIYIYIYILSKPVRLSNFRSYITLNNGLNYSWYHIPLSSWL